MEKQIGIAVGCIAWSMLVQAVRCALNSRKKGVVIVMPTKCGKTYLSSRLSGGDNLVLVDLDERIMLDNDVMKSERIHNTHTKFLTCKKQMLSIVREIKNNAKPKRVVLLTSNVELARALDNKYKLLKLMPTKELFNRTLHDKGFSAETLAKCEANFNDVLMMHCDEQIVFDSYEGLYLQIANKYNLYSEVF